jgi:hypothetical protein
MSAYDGESEADGRPLSANGTEEEGEAEADPTLRYEWQRGKTKEERLVAIEKRRAELLQLEMASSREAQLVR